MAGVGVREFPTSTSQFQAPPADFFLWTFVTELSRGQDALKLKTHNWYAAARNGTLNPATTYAATLTAKVALLSWLNGTACKSTVKTCSVDNQRMIKVPGTLHDHWSSASQRGG